MRLALCTLSAVMLSGCSWLGMGGNSSNSYNQYGAGGGYGCATGQYGGGQYAYGNQHGYVGQGGAGCAGAGGYDVATNGYGAPASSYGMNAYGAPAGAQGLRGPQNVNQYGMNGHGYNAGGGAGYGANSGTVLGAGTQFGSAVGGQYGHGQMVAGGGSGAHQTVQGAPIYVQQPYPAYHGASAGGGQYGYGAAGCGQKVSGCGAALPFGLEAGIGTNFSIDGDIFPGEAAKPFIGGPGTVSDLVPVSYSDAYKEAVHYDLAATYDIDPSTTVLARVGYSNAEGNRLLVGQVDDGLGLTEDLYAEFGDLEEVTLEGGVRKYMGGWNNRFAGVRPYVGATAGFTHNGRVELTQSSATLVDPALFTQSYINPGWTPTASGVLGAEMQVGARTAIGVEAGIRWSDDLDTNFDTGDRISVPVRLRGRVSF